MITISLCMIVRDEEKTLARILQSVGDIVDEIIIVDTGSTDKTKEIAFLFTDNVYDFVWVEDFAAARNFSFSKATQSHILWLDADDILKEEDRVGLKLLKQTLSPDIDRVTMPYNLAFDGEGKVTSSLRRNRLVRRECGFQWIGPVHEYLAVSGNYLDSDVCITHHKQKSHTDRNLQIYRKRQQAGEQFSVRDLYYFANELKDHALYEEAAGYYDAMLNTGQGWIEDNIQACLKLSECYTHLTNQTKRFESLTRALRYETPRPEVSCALGNYFIEEEKYETAIFWYQQAISITPAETMGMMNRTASTWYPHLQLCLCYDRIGEYKQAFEHNERALQSSPAHPSMLYNRNYFRTAHNLVASE
ncbi:glycosyltransferase [Paenibacillus sp. FJAT-26967]|uniref:glycosyltransferase n=1 Tax=Paenibacillus sp. FJAT-26967 TaxID=1729690 RepID=UPI0008390203|nr:glycosyltransferase [Paenibacillus sp. FJAT-26967]